MIQAKEPQNIALLVEGDGDSEAIPLLLRKVVEHKECFEIGMCSRPIKAGDLVGALKGEKFTRLLGYALQRSDSHGVLIILDCEDHCPVEAVTEIYDRIKEQVERTGKPVAIALFVREYETMFIANAEHMSKLSKSILIDHKKLAGGNAAGLRDAKTSLSSMITNSTYRETRDQARLTAVVDVEEFSKNYDPLAHLVRVMHWFSTRDKAQLFYGM